MPFIREHRSRSPSGNHHSERRQHSGFCHYTVTGNGGTSTQTEGGWIVVGKPAATFAVSGSNNQVDSVGTALSQPLAVTLTSVPSGFTSTGASVLFNTSACTLSNGCETLIDRPDLRSGL